MAKTCSKHKISDVFYSREVYSGIKDISWKYCSLRAHTKYVPASHLFVLFHFIESTGLKHLEYRNLNVCYFAISSLIMSIDMKDYVILQTCCM